MKATVLLATFVLGMLVAPLAPEAQATGTRPGDTERARGMSTTPPSAARSARRTYAVVSRRASTADPEELHRSGTTPRAGAPRWPHTGGATTQALHYAS